MQRVRVAFRGSAVLEGKKPRRGKAPGLRLRRAARDPRARALGSRASFASGRVGAGGGTGSFSSTFNLLVLQRRRKERDDRAEQREAGDGEEVAYGTETARTLRGGGGGANGAREGTPRRYRRSRSPTRRRGSCWSPSRAPGRTRRTCARRRAPTPAPSAGDPTQAAHAAHPWLAFCERTKKAAAARLRGDAASAHGRGRGSPERRDGRLRRDEGRDGGEHQSGEEVVASHRAC